MKILLVYPKYPDTFWSFKYALKFISKKSSLPPLGLLTVAAMLPPEWELRLTDMSVKKLTDADLRWADYVFSERHVHPEGVGTGRDLPVQGARRKSDRRRPPVHGDAGGVRRRGPSHSERSGGHAAALSRRPEKGQRRSGSTPLPDWADLSATPVPRFDLLNMKKYASMNIQYSRGCPFDCEFCNITVLFGRVPRTKSARTAPCRIRQPLPPGVEERRVHRR